MWKDLSTKRYYATYIEQANEHILLTSILVIYYNAQTKMMSSQSYLNITYTNMSTKNDISYKLYSCVFTK